MLLQMTVRGINGLSNRTSLGVGTSDADPDFYAVIAALRRLQVSGDVSMRMEKHGGEDVGIVVFSTRRNEQAVQDLDFVTKALHLSPGNGGELNLTFGALPRNGQEIAVLSRSMLGVLLEVGSGIEVPGADVSVGRTGQSSRRPDAPDPRDRPLVSIYSGASAPAGTYAAVHYRNAWYWIRDDDLGSKRVFTYLMLFFSLAETGVVSQPPVVTIPAN
jgi:hypothetical protein